MRCFEHKEENKMKLGIARVATLHSVGSIDVDLCYKVAQMQYLEEVFLISLRLAMVAVEAKGKLNSLLAYSTHTTGVILRAYDSQYLRNADQKVSLSPRSKSQGLVALVAEDKPCSIIGVSQEEKSKANDNTEVLVFEASYLNPDILVEAVAEHKLSTDTLYYKTSRGSNPDLNFGFSVLEMLLHTYAKVQFYEGHLSSITSKEQRKVSVSAKEISDIIGMKLELSRIVTILSKLGFSINKVADETASVLVPSFRHDIKHIQDIAEEVLRIIGINNIPVKALAMTEKPRLNTVTNRYQIKKSLRNTCVGLGCYENVSYVFSDRKVLEQYGFVLTKEALDIANPIAQELNTLRSTLLINLLNAVKRNVSHTIKSIPLFEIGAVFDTKRQEKEMFSMVISGEVEVEAVFNAGKAAVIDFASFVQKLSSAIGKFDLVPCTYSNGLIHPYQSANILIDGKVCGFMSKLHPTVQESYGIPVTYMAEVDFDSLLPTHITVNPISKFQGVYKDLSIVIDKSLNYFEVAKVLKELELDLLKDSYPVDIYEDEKLGDKKSLSIRFFIQSMEKTLEESDIESVMSEIMNALVNSCNATLR
jgi:phenylalanyl-tRNA synthetase beta chain